jgi:hydrogenase maturation protein HypF
VGADLKSALCVVTADTAILGQHVGDLESLESQEFFAEVRRNLERLFRVRPTLVAHDLHPGYHSTSMARRMGLPLVPVQHHHAHIASCLADNGRSQRVIGVAWDGTGYGPDGSVWGGEFLVADLAAFERVGRIRPVPLAGGDAAVRQPWRMALAHLIEAGAGVERIRAKQRSTVEAMIREGVHTVATSSAGRLFDAVASLLGVRDEVSYEGQAAMEIEALADTEDHELFPLPAVDEGGLIEMDARPLVRAIAAAVAAGVAPGTISARFHATLAHAIADVCTRIREGSRLSTVALSGGCFQNALLTRLTVEALQRAGFEVITHARVPPNDGGLALGQAAVAAWLAGR